MAALTDQSTTTPHMPDPGASCVEYERFLLTQLTLIRGLSTKAARRQHLTPAQTQDFLGDVLVHLIEDNYAVLRKFRRQSSLRTFLGIVIKRLCLDARIAEWGKWRPSVHSRRAGDIVVMIERLTMRDGLTFDEACATLRTNHQLVFDDRTLEKHFGRFNHRSRPHFVSQEYIEDEPASGSVADGSLMDRDADHMLSRAAAAMTATLHSLPVEERNILMLHFRDGMTVASIARQLGVDQKLLHRRVASTLKRLRTSLEAAHVRKPDLLGAIGRSGGVSVGFLGQTARKLARTSSRGVSAVSVPA